MYGRYSVHVHCTCTCMCRFDFLGLLVREGLVPSGVFVKGGSRDFMLEGCNRQL